MTSEVSFDDVVYLKASVLNLDPSKIDIGRVNEMVDKLINNNKFLASKKVIVCGHCKDFMSFDEDNIEKCPHCNKYDSFEVYLKTSTIGFSPIKPEFC